MDDFVYSDDALNVLSVFYEAERILYVEGDDDVVFWEGVLEKFGVESFKVKPADGLPALVGYIEKIDDGLIDSAAARDRDYSFLHHDTSHENVLYTYGHSIENTLLFERAICRVAKTYGRLGSSHISEEEFLTWLEDFYEKIKPIVVYEAAKEHEENGLLVMGDNCSRFMVGKSSHLLSEEKIRNYLVSNSIPEQLDEAVALVEEKIKDSEREVSDFVKGHFLFSACLRFVNYKLRIFSNKSMSRDGFFSGLALAFDSFFDERHPHYYHYLDQVRKLG